MQRVLPRVMLALLWSVANTWHFSQAFASAPVFDHSKAPSSSYIVQHGDTLYSIAFAVGMDYRLLAAANGIATPYRIHEGQRLRLHEVSHNKAAHVLAAKASHQASTSMAPSAHHHQRFVPQRNIHWQWPAQGRITARFRLTKPVNAGINLAGISGEPIKAAASGQVVYSGNGVFGYGNLIIVQHNQNYLSAYALNRQNLVKEGQWVQQGQMIARMGSGIKNTPLLHFEIRKAGKPVNPLQYLPERKFLSNHEASIHRRVAV